MVVQFATIPYDIQKEIVAKTHIVTLKNLHESSKCGREVVTSEKRVFSAQCLVITNDAIDIVLEGIETRELKVNWFWAKTFETCPRFHIYSIQCPWKVPNGTLRELLKDAEEGLLLYKTTKLWMYSDIGIELVVLNRFLEVFNVDNFFICRFHRDCFHLSSVQTMKEITLSDSVKDDEWTLLQGPIMHLTYEDVPINALKQFFKEWLHHKREIKEFTMFRGQKYAYTEILDGEEILSGLPHEVLWTPETTDGEVTSKISRIDSTFARGILPKAYYLLKNGKTALLVKTGMTKISAMKIELNQF